MKKIKEWIVDRITTREIRIKLSPNYVEDKGYCPNIEAFEDRTYTKILDLNFTYEYFGTTEKMWIELQKKVDKDHAGSVDDFIKYLWTKGLAYILSELEDEQYTKELRDKAEGRYIRLDKKTIKFLKDNR